MNTRFTTTVLLFILLIGTCTIVVSCGSKSKEEPKEEKAQSIFADGKYCYIGTWRSEQYPPQRCMVEFEKIQDRIVSCVYTNLKYNVPVTLEGRISNDTLYFKGNINNSDLDIDLHVCKNSVLQVEGRGYDAAHLDHAVLVLEKTDPLGDFAGKYVNSPDGDPIMQYIFEKDGTASFNVLGSLSITEYTYVLRGNKVYYQIVGIDDVDSLEYDSQKKMIVGPGGDIFTLE